jgi:hypothetical protein
MKTIIPVGKRLAVGVVAVGALSLGWTGLAGAAPIKTPAVTSTFNCARATKVLTRIEKGEARIAAGLPRLTAAKDAAQKAGRTKRVARLDKRIAHLKSAKFAGRLDKATAAIEAKCHVSAPPVTGTPPVSSTTDPS